MMYFLDNCERGEVSILSIFKQLYQLKETDVRESSRFYYFSPCWKVQTIIRNQCKNLHLKRVVDGVGGNQGCEDIFSDSDNISCKLNEAMDTDTLIGSDSKKQHRQKMRFDRGGPVNVVTPIHYSMWRACQLLSKRTHSLALIRTPPSFAHWNSPMAFAVKRVPIEVEKDFLSSLRHLLFKVGTLSVRYARALDKELIDTKVELKRVKECGVKLAVEKERRITAEVKLRTATASEFFVEEGEGSGTADMALSVIGDTVNSIPPSVTGGVTIASSAVEAVALIDADQSVKGDDKFSSVNLNCTVGSFALANYFGGRGSSHTNLDFIAESFALTNYFGGRSSLPINLDFTSGSFALTNYFRGLPTNLDFTARSFALANCFGGYNFSSTNLDFTVGSFGGYNFSSTNLDFTVGSFALANCF
ncbi:hypothetical protein GOBAR_AA06820 [Gossypium barbadense]|uniref:Uncharacterized protein n=1 Tax=Gossypium barbadense TaxID=3634 RepID=A0A2P5YDT3_GOSBA|nr:hypothetical protein GOBAR_AA06820 [Gossypium barbadense]